jgi:hypothetical protein
MPPKTDKQNSQDITQMTVDLAVILNKVIRIECDVKDINAKLEKDYVTQDQFTPVKNIVYGLVSVILLAVVGALVALVIK